MLCTIPQNTLRHHWDELQDQRAALESTKLQPRSEVLDTPATALAAVRRMAQDVRPARMHVLVTGSLYLVGNMLRLLKR
jgi:folylpolyglutamate synthase